MIIINKEYKQLTKNDFFVGVIDYEPRSLYLLTKNKRSRNASNTLLLCLDNKHYDEYSSSLSNELSGKGIIAVDCQSYSEQQVVAHMLEFLNSMPPHSTLHIDYSSMPRDWYCRLPKALLNLGAKSKNIYFWYVPGGHIGDNFPTAGINRIYYDHGNVDPTEKPRYHIMGLGYDKFRSEAVYNIVEPENLVICYSFSPTRNKTKEIVIKQNQRLINNSINVIDFPLNDFAGMVSKLQGLVLNYLRYGQVIIVPDGTKPLILAMSMISDVMGNKDTEFGLTCLFIERSKDCKNIEVDARSNEIYGFQIK